MVIIMSDDILKKCRLCPRNCLVNRYIDVGFCGASSDIKLARADLHYYEEPSISGISGSSEIISELLSYRPHRSVIFRK